MACPVCGQPSEPDRADFCPAHARALESVRKAIEAWANAFGGIAQANFLNRVSRLKGTGKNAKEIVEFLQQHSKRFK